MMGKEKKDQGSTDNERAAEAGQQSEGKLAGSVGRLF